MCSLFRKNKKSKQDITPQMVTLKPIDYEPKIIIAWVKAIEGNDDIAMWLRDNHFELFMATYAIYLKEEARDWLTNNGYAHLMAFINAAEGSETAQKWLQHHKFDLLYHMALAIEDEQDSWKWLVENATQDLFILTKAIKTIKDKIEENHNDIHVFRKDI